LHLHLHAHVRAGAKNEAETEAQQQRIVREEAALQARVAEAEAEAQRRAAANAEANLRDMMRQMERMHLEMERKQREMDAMEVSSRMPDHWDQGCMGDPGDYSQVRESHYVSVPHDSDEFASAANRLHASIGRGAAEITRVERVQNQMLWTTYATKLKFLQLKNGGDANEEMLWHGTGHTHPREILASEGGLDMRFGGDAAFYGRGIYAAERAAYSNAGYAFQEPGVQPRRGGGGLLRRAGEAGDSRVLLLVQVAVGSVSQWGKRTDRSTKIPPVKPGSNDRYDSIRGGPHGRPPAASMNYTVYDNSQVYPAYLVTYSYFGEGAGGDITRR
jgi:hypothetical protein